PLVSRQSVGNNSGTRADAAGGSPADLRPRPPDPSRTVSPGERPASERELHRAADVEPRQRAGPARRPKPAGSERPGPRPGPPRTWRAESARLVLDLGGAPLGVARAALAPAARLPPVTGGGSRRLCARPIAAGQADGGHPASCRAHHHLSLRRG